MRPLVRTTGIAGLSAGIGLVLLAAAIPRNAPIAPAIVTTDTRQYCLQLFARIHELLRARPGIASDQAVALAADGDEMCDQGEVREGVLRLLRALALVTYELDASKARPPGGP